MDGQEANDQSRRSSDVYATRTEVQALTVKLDDVASEFKALSEQVLDTNVTLKQVLSWLKGDYNDKGQYEPGLIEQNRRMVAALGTGTKWIIALLGTIATSAVGIAFTQAAHAIGWKP